MLSLLFVPELSPVFASVCVTQDSDARHSSVHGGVEPNHTDGSVSVAALSATRSPAPHAVTATNQCAHSTAHRHATAPGCAGSSGTRTVTALACSHRPNALKSGARPTCRMAWVLFMVCVVVHRYLSSWCACLSSFETHLAM